MGNAKRKEQPFQHGNFPIRAATGKYYKRIYLEQEGEDLAPEYEPPTGWEAMQWYVGVIRPKPFVNEVDRIDQARREMICLDVKHWVPFGTNVKRGRKLKKIFEPVPLFPGYILIAYTKGANLARLCQSETLSALLGSNGIPSRVNGMRQLVDAIRAGRYDGSNKKYRDPRTPEIGQEVELPMGKNASVNARVIENSNPNNLKLQVMLFGGETLVKISIDALFANRKA